MNDQKAPKPLPQLAPMCPSRVVATTSFALSTPWNTPNLLNTLYVLATLSAENLLPLNLRNSILPSTTTLPQTPPFYPTLQVHFHHHLTHRALQNLHGKTSALNSHNIARLLDIIKHSCSGMFFFFFSTLNFYVLGILLHLSLALSLGPDIYIINNEQQVIGNSQCL